MGGTNESFVAGRTIVRSIAFRSGINQSSLLVMSVRRKFDVVKQELIKETEV